MLKFALSRGIIFAGFKVNKFQAKDYKTMCSLIKQKHPIYNEAIQLHKDIKLLDQQGKLIGRYTASQARKKASTIKKDIVLVNQQSDPAICKAYNFRQTILKKFYDQIVNKRNEQLLSRATASKQLKISVNLTENQLQIKSKQIIELSKKNSKVRIYAISKKSQQNVALSKFDFLKSLIQNKCIIEQDVKMQDYQEQDQETFQKDKKKPEQSLRMFSMVVKSKQNQFNTLLNQSSQKDPDSAIEIFLARYYKQQDVQMKDLKQGSAANKKVQSLTMTDIASQIIKMDQPKQKKRVFKTQGKTQEVNQKINEAEVQKKQKIWKNNHSFTDKQANARILNERLRRILQIGQ